MSKRVQMAAFHRAGSGRSAANKARRAGKIPAVLYGLGEPVGLEVNAKELVTLLNTTHAEHMLVDLAVTSSDGGNQKKMAIVQDLQIDPLKDTVLHVDFHEINENSHIHVEIPIHAVGEAVGVRSEGGVLDHLIHKLRVSCLPKDLPDQIEVDVTNLALGQSIHVGELKLPTGVEALVAKDLSVFMVHAPRVVEEPAPGTATEQTEPEVLKEKKPAEGEAKPGEAKADPKAKADTKADSKAKAEAKPKAEGKK